MQGWRRCLRHVSRLRHTEHGPSGQSTAGHRWFSGSPRTGRRGDSPEKVRKLGSTRRRNQGTTTPATNVEERVTHMHNVKRKIGVTKSLSWTQSMDTCTPRMQRAHTNWRHARVFERAGSTPSGRCPTLQDCLKSTGKEKANQNHWKLSSGSTMNKHYVLFLRGVLPCR